jgi:hypothetical protein
MHPVAVVDEAELGRLATMIARLTPAQQRLVAALADLAGSTPTWSLRRPRPRRLTGRLSLAAASSSRT